MPARGSATKKKVRNDAKFYAFPDGRAEWLSDWCARGGHHFWQNLLYDEAPDPEAWEVGVWLKEPPHWATWEKGPSADAAAGRAIRSLRKVGVVVDWPGETERPSSPAYDALSTWCAANSYDLQLVGMNAPDSVALYLWGPPRSGVEYRREAGTLEEAAQLIADRLRARGLPVDG